eukprot:scaffold1505_cov256-Pinguiococcus_pyrenoidosus.AAC.4
MQTWLGDVWPQPRLTLFGVGTYLTEWDPLGCPPRSAQEAPGDRCSRPSRTWSPLLLLHVPDGHRLQLCFRRRPVLELLPHEFDVLFELQVLHGEGDDGWVLLDVEVVLGESVDHENQVVRQVRDHVLLPILLPAYELIRPHLTVVLPEDLKQRSLRHHVAPLRVLEQGGWRNVQGQEKERRLPLRRLPAFHNGRTGLHFFWRDENSRHRRRDGRRRAVRSTPFGFLGTPRQALFLVLLVSRFGFCGILFFAALQLHDLPRAVQLLHEHSAPKRSVHRRAALLLAATQAGVQGVEKPRQKLRRVGCLPDHVALVRGERYGLHELVRTDAGFEVLITPDLPHQSSKPLCQGNQVPRRTVDLQLVLVALLP